MALIVAAFWPLMALHGGAAAGVEAGWLAGLAVVAVAVRQGGKRIAARNAAAERAAAAQAATERAAAAQATAERDAAEWAARTERDAAAQAAQVERDLAAAAEWNERTYRMTVSDVAVSPAAGGSFTLTAPEGTMHLDVPADMALSFRSLRDKDVVQVTLTADGQGIEEFWHLARGNGATPRDPANFPHGLGGAIRRPAPGQQEAAPEQQARS
jgi:hypothetical protein